MSLNQLQLPPKLLAELYPDCLIQTAAIAVPAPAGPAHLGHNAKGVLIVVNKPEVSFLEDGELAFLTKVLGACDLSLGDVAIVNWNRLALPDPAALQEHFGSRTVLLFGIAPLDFGLPFHFPAYQLQAFNGRTYLQAPALADIEPDVTAKKALWTSLKKLFTL